jgi:hypothetical protein
MATFGGAQRQMLPGPVGDLETARLASGAANVVAYIANPTAHNSGTDSYTWAEVVGPDGQTVTAELRAGEGVGATAAIAAETTKRVLAGVKPGAWTAGQLFGAALVTDATAGRLPWTDSRHERRQAPSATSTPRPLTVPRTPTIRTVPALFGPRS